MSVVTGCTVGPNYQKPEPVVQEKWGEMPEKGLTSAPMEEVRWWTLFQDDELDSLIDRAVRSNKDLKVAEARILQARAQRRAVASQLYPSVDSAGSYARSRRSENVPGQNGNEQNLFQADFDAFWELDLFGGVRRSVEAANAEIGASEENLNDVLVTLLGEVATNYLQLRGNQRRIVIARENIKTQQDTVELTWGRFRAGLGSNLEVAQAEALLATTEARIPSLETAVQQAIHRLGVLLGVGPDALAAELSGVEPIPSTPPEVPIGLPSELLRRRPDVRRAERQLAASTALVGVATAELFPKFSLTGILGLQSADLSNFVSSASRFYSLGPNVLWPVFDAGRIRANIQVQSALQKQAFFTYENTVLLALEDVEDAIVAYSKEQATRQSLFRAVDQTRKADEIARALYAKGLVDFLNVLQSESSLYQLQDQLVQSEQRVSTSLVALFKALGGGWQILPEQAYQAEKGGRGGPEVQKVTFQK